MNPEVAAGYLPLVTRIIKGEAIASPEDKAIWEDGVDLKAYHKAEALNSVQGVSVVIKKNRWVSFNDAPFDSIAEIVVSGPLMKVGECGAAGYDAYSDWIREADQSPRINSIILRMDTPGGAVYGVSKMADAIRGTSKPIIAFVDDGMSASAGYWLASQADEIVLSHSTSEVGSIGVYTTLADWYSYFEKEGLKVWDIYAPESKEKNDYYRLALEGKEDKMKERLSSLAQTFITTVKEGRGDKINLSKGDPFKGAMFAGQAAIDVGLADRISSYQEVVIGLASKKDNKDSNSNTMATKQYGNVNAALGVDSLEANEDGVYLNQEQLASLDAALDNSDLEASNQTLTDGATATLSAVNQQLKAAGEQPVENANDGITRLGALVQDYGGASGARFTKAKPGDKPEENGNDAATRAQQINDKIAREAGANL